MSFLIYKHGRRDQPKVALTFDDGPNPPRTDQILDILASRNVRAAFFVIGKWVERWPQAFERMVRAGHVIGNHSYLHDPELGDFDRAEAVLGNAMGRPTNFLRAHYFHYHLCAQSSVALLPETKIVDSDVNPSDWSLTDPGEIVRRCLEAKELQGGSIIDLHDGSETDNDAARLARPLPVVAALPRLIDGLTSRGYKLVGLDEMELVDPTPWSPSFAKSSL
jgi:peptidoglycan/xylan/chitin deacetylase (PgdA/CDA1 family)